MTQANPTQVCNDILATRGADYGDAWLLAGYIISFLGDDLDLLIKTPYTHNWTIILSKLIRILKSPTEVDHWIDIRNYAELVVTHLQGVE